jgi:uncharacterized membrane protein|tara:strand:- start:755 stop:1225 length:471 start_codon:yes stop_codon:yes gene_type:complete
MEYLSKVDLGLRVILGSFFLGLPLLAISAPIIQTTFGFPNGEGIYSFLSPICHQYPTRSLWILNRPFALCSRCFSGYFGLGIGFLFFRSQNNYLKRLILGIGLLIPGVLDGLIQLWTSYESTNTIRFFTGFSGGLGVFYIIHPFSSLKNKTKGSVK